MKLSKADQKILAEHGLTAADMTKMIDSVIKREMPAIKKRLEQALTAKN